MWYTRFMALQVINAFDGHTYRVGESFPIPGYATRARLLDVDDRFLSASALIQMPGEGSPRWSQLAVRFTHPSYFLQRVAFIPT